MGMVDARSCSIRAQEARELRASEAKAGEVAVANGDAAARDQQAVDRGHQAAEQRAGGKEADGCSLEHGCPLSEVAERFRFVMGTIYVYQMPETTGLFAWQQSIGCSA